MNLNEKKGVPHSPPQREITKEKEREPMRERERERTKEKERELTRERKPKKKLVICWPAKLLPGWTMRRSVTMPPQSSLKPCMLSWREREKKSNVYASVNILKYWQSELPLTWDWDMSYLGLGYEPEVGELEFKREKGHPPFPTSERKREPKREY